MRWIARNFSGKSWFVARSPGERAQISHFNRLKKVQGKKKRDAAIAAGTGKQATKGAEELVKSIKIEAHSQDTTTETVAESVVPEATIVEEVAEEPAAEVTAEEDAVEETGVAEPEAVEVTVDLLSTKDEDVIF